jgi:hypothetical protein
MVYQKFLNLNIPIKIMPLNTPNHILNKYKGLIILHIPHSDNINIDLFHINIPILLLKDAMIHFCKYFCKKLNEKELTNKNLKCPIFHNLNNKDIIIYQFNLKKKIISNEIIKEKKLLMNDNNSSKEYSFIFYEKLNTIFQLDRIIKNFIYNICDYSVDNLFYIKYNNFVNYVMNNIKKIKLFMF